MAAELSAFCEPLTEDSLTRLLSYRNLKGEHLSLPLGPVMLQLANHSTYHRGQVATLLRQLGAEPRPTDLVVYWREEGEFTHEG